MQLTAQTDQVIRLQEFDLDGGAILEVPAMRPGNSPEQVHETAWAVSEMKRPPTVAPSPLS
jgi:hypothetical protein